VPRRDQERVREPALERMEVSRGRPGIPASQVSPLSAFELSAADLKSSHCNQPAETYEQELTCPLLSSRHCTRTADLVFPSDQFSGLAIRMATDLNLQRQSTVSLPENVSAEARVRFNQEVLNRERVWMHCYVTDRRWVFSVSHTSMFLT
jgi:hypothetical protein